MKYSLNLILVLAVLMIVVTGCSKVKRIKTEMVTGTVTMEGAPVADAVVSFTPEKGADGLAACGRTDAKGVYTLSTVQGYENQGTLPGKYIVTISKSVQIDTGETEENEALREVVPVIEYTEGLPEVYKHTNTSPLRATVTSGQENKIDFTLESSE